MRQLMELHQQRAQPPREHEPQKSQKNATHIFTCFSEVTECVHHGKITYYKMFIFELSHLLYLMSPMPYKSPSCI